MKTKIFWSSLGAIVLIASACVSQQLVKAPSSVSADQKTRAPAQTDTLTYERFVQLLEREQPRTVAETLNLLRQAYPTYLSYHTFMYNSFSLQKADFQNPRAIVFGPDSKFILTFNGDPQQKSYDTLELMRFKEDTKEFEFREVRFAAERNAHTADEALPAGKVFEISAPNGNNGKCLMCHDDSPKPNWGTYADWPGAYGSRDDFRKYGADYRPAFHATPGDVDWREWTEYQRFMQGNRTRGRYAFLPTRATVSQNLINDALSKQLNDLMGKKIVQQFKNRPEWYAKRYRFLETLVCTVESVSAIQPRAGWSHYEHLNPDGSRSSQEYPNRELTNLEKMILNRQILYSLSVLEQTSRDQGIDRAQIIRSDRTRPYASLIEFKRTFRFAQAEKDIFYHWALSHINFLSVVQLAKMAEIIDPTGTEIGKWSLPIGSDSFDFRDGRDGFAEAPLAPFLLPEFIRELTPDLIPDLRFDVNSPNGDYGARSFSEDRLHDCQTIRAKSI